MLHGGGPEEIELTGGGTTRVVRVGQTVRRPAKPWSPAIRELIRQLRTAGVAAVPAWHGIDEQGRDVFDFIPGDVGHYPLPAHVRSDRALVTAARLLRQLHDASVSLLDGRARPWQFPPMEPVEVICHGDFAPYNCIFRNGEAVGVFDFDAARPGPRRWIWGTRSTGSPRSPAPPTVTGSADRSSRDDGRGCSSTPMAAVPGSDGRRSRR